MYGWEVYYATISLHDFMDICRQLPYYLYVLLVLLYVFFYTFYSWIDIFMFSQQLLNLIEKFNLLHTAVPPTGTVIVYQAYAQYVTS